MIAQLVNLKDYVDGALIRCNQACFDLIVAAEIIFRQMQLQFMSFSGNVKCHVINAIMIATTESVFPNCHDIKSRLIMRFVGARLQFFAKRQRKRRAETMSTTAHELSSKSMRMQNWKK